MNNLLSCPHCRGQITEDGTLAGQIVSCPYCQQQIQMPHRSPLSQVNIVYLNHSSSEQGSGYANLSYRQKRTDIFATICFASGVCGFFIMPIITVPICLVSGIISSFRLSEDHNLKGHGLRVIGILLGIAEMLHLWWVFATIAD